MSATAPARRTNWHDAFDAQMALWRWTRPDGFGHGWLREAWQQSSRDLQPDTRRMTAHLYDALNQQLLDADPIFVSAEMCDLVDAARASFQPEPLLPTDLITAHGFLFYEHPIVIPDKWGSRTPITAFSWAPVLSRPTPSPDAAAEFEEIPWTDSAALDYFRGKDYTDVWAGGNESVDGIAICLWQPAPIGSQAYENGTRHVPIHITPWWFGMGMTGNEWDEVGEPTGAEWWWRLAQTTFRLMQQQISSHSRYQPDRPARREMQRRGWAPRDVVVVQLRRQRDGTMPDDGPHADAHYSHRFIVGGHWRNQWYPASNVHRQIWISPYVKGPEDAPLLVKPRRAYTWTR